MELVAVKPGLTQREQSLKIYIILKIWNQGPGGFCGRLKITWLVGEGEGPGRDPLQAPVALVL